MNPLFTDRARDLMSKSYRLYVSGDILQGGRVVAENIAVGDDWEISVDGTAAVRRTLSGSIPDVEPFLPLTANSLLSPFLSEIRVWLGVYYDDENFDRWPVFTGSVVQPDLADTGDIALKFSASDRAQFVSDRRFAFPYVIADGTAVVTAIQGIITSVLPQTVFNVSNSALSASTPALVIDELEDRWSHVDDLAASSGLEVFFDGFGTCWIRPIPDPDTQASVWTFAEGDQATVKEIDQSVNPADSFSHAMVKGQSADGTHSPVRSDVYDLDPTSPTYFDPSLPGGTPFGDRPIDLTSDLITTQAQSDAAAVGLLSRKKRATQDLDFTTVPISALDEHDVVGIKRAALGIDSLFMLESFNIPCYPSGEMKAHTRTGRI